MKLRITFCMVKTWAAIKWHAALAVVVAVAGVLTVFAFCRYGLPGGTPAPALSFGTIERVLMNGRSGERRDSIIFSPVRLTFLGRSAGGELGRHSLRSLPEGESYVRVDFSFGAFGETPETIRIVAAELSGGSGAVYEPLRAQYCGADNQADPVSDPIDLPVKVPCESAYLFAVSEQDEPFSLWASYQLVSSASTE